MMDIKLKARRPSFFVSGLLAMTAVSLIPNVAVAQTTMFEGFLTAPSLGVLDTNQRNQTLWDSVAKRGDDETTNRPPQTGPRFLGPPVQKPPNLAVLRFTVNPALRKTVTSEFATKLTAGKTASPLGRFVMGGEALRGVHRKMALAGLSPSNVGDSMTFLIAGQWALARGQPATPAKPVMQAFGKQVARMLANQPETARMTNETKQRQADSSMLLMAIMLKAMEEAQGDAKAIADLTGSAHQVLKGMGFDPASFELTAQGLVAAR